MPRQSVDAANRQSDALRALLNGPAILMMPGAYDALSARLFEALGFSVIRGSSAIAATFGLRDGQVMPNNGRGLPTHGRGRRRPGQR